MEKSEPQDNGEDTEYKLSLKRDWEYVTAETKFSIGQSATFVEDFPESAEWGIATVDSPRRVKHPPKAH